MSTIKEFNQRIVECRIKLANLNGKEEMVNKYHEKVKETCNIFDGLDEHMKEQTKNIQNATAIYFERMTLQDESAKQFCKDKTTEELKDYLANRPVAYNDWRNANLDELKTLVLGVYEEY